MHNAKCGLGYIMPKKCLVIVFVFNSYTNIIGTWEKTIMVGIIENDTPFIMATRGID